VEELFQLFDGHLNRQGYIARGGQIQDASIVPVPRNHNTRDENAAIKKGEVPEGWTDKPAKRMQKDVDARWMKKHGKSHYGYKNHVNVDRKHKLVRCYHISDAALHDSQMLDHLLIRGNTGSGVWADAAYRSEEMEVKLCAQNLKSHIHRKGKRGKPLTEQAKGSNRTKSTVRVRVEHVFGAQTNDMGGTLGAHHWPGSSQGQDRDEEPRLQYAPALPVASQQLKPCVRNARAKAQVMRNHLKIDSASTDPMQQSVS
jgi:IS5 family transposase